MLLRRVDIDSAGTFFLLNSSIVTYRRLTHTADDVPYAAVVRRMLDALRLAVENGWFYVNPRNEDQLIAYCDDGPRPFWLVVAPGDRDGFKHVDKDYVCVTCLGHRDSRFADAIREHREATDAEGPS